MMFVKKFINIHYKGEFKMKEILDDYFINEKTAVIMPAYNIDFESIVIETNDTKHVKKHPFRLIEENCLMNGASYDGRRRAIVYLTGFSRCVPIPINPKKDIFTFPTHSPKSDACSWIFYNHIDHIEKTKQNKKSLIHLKNGQTLPFNISFYTLSNQKFRMFVCREKVLNCLN